MKKLFPFITATLFLFSACSTDFDVIDDYKETTVVYGLLDQNDSIHYIRVNKAFLGEGNALHMAQEFDSINYANQLSVTIEEIQNGVVKNTTVLQKDNSIEKESGIFNNSKNILFSFNSVLNPLSVYKLNLINNSTKNVVTGETPLISNFNIVSPKTTTTSFDFAGSNPAVTLNQTKTIEWISGSNGRLYEVILRFHYTEVNKGDNSKVYKYIDWVFPSQKSINLSGGETMKINFKGFEFYKFVASALQSNNDIWRYPGKLDFLFSVASEEFNTYMEVNAPSTGIVQEKPLYSNIDNGVGLFSSRLRDSRKNLNLSTNSLVQLYIGDYTKNLSFCDSVPGRTYSCQ